MFEAVTGDLALRGDAALEAQVAVAETQVDQAQAQLDFSLAQLGYTKIRSPVDGIVIGRSIAGNLLRIPLVNCIHRTVRRFIESPRSVEGDYFFYPLAGGTIVGCLAFLTTMFWLGQRRRRVNALWVG